MATQDNMISLVFGPTFLYQPIQLKSIDFYNILFKMLGIDINKVCPFKLELEISMLLYPYLKHQTFPRRHDFIPFDIKTTYTKINKLSEDIKKL